MLAILIAIIIYYVYYAIAMLNYLSTKYLTVSKSERKYKKIYNIIERENYEILSGIQRKIMEF